MRVKEVAQAAGITPDTVRYYEKTGLLPKPPRTGSGYRQFEPEYVERIRFIKGAQRMGLRLKDIKELLEIRDKGLCPCGHTAAALQGRIEQIDRDLGELRKLRRQLLAISTQLTPGASRDASGKWPCEKEFVDVGRKRR